MANKKPTAALTLQQKVKVLTKLFESGCKTEKDLKALNLQSILQIPDITVPDMTVITELQEQVAKNRLFRFYCAIVAALTLVMGMSVTAFAAGGDPIQVVNNLSDFIFGLIRAIGLILLGFGIVQVGLSLKSHDPSQRANGFLTLAGGVIITFAKEILTLITG